LLDATQHARHIAASAFELIASHRTGPGELSEQERLMVEDVLSRPMVLRAKALEREYRAAISALTRLGDEDVRTLFQAPTPLDAIQRAMHVPDVLMWKIQLLVDLQLRDSDQLRIPR
jgi:hypothetical protein